MLYCSERIGGLCWFLRALGLFAFASTTWYLYVPGTPDRRRDGSLKVVTGVSTLDPIPIDKAVYYADPIPSFRFWSDRKSKTLSCKIETGFLCGDHARVILFFACVIQGLDFWAQKIQANVDYCYVRRRAERTSLGP